MSTDPLNPKPQRPPPERKEDMKAPPLSDTKVVARIIHEKVAELNAMIHHAHLLGLELRVRDTAVQTHIFGGYHRTSPYPQLDIEILEKL